MPMEVLSYNTLEGEATGEIVVKKSRFIANIFHVESEDEALSILERMRKQYWDARHNCYGYIIGKNKELVRFSDDGEPGGTAGVPMLDVLLKENLVDVCVVGTRYFGGTLLGAGGLVRAYSHTSKIAVEAAHIITMAECDVMSVAVDYSFYERMNIILFDFSANIKDSDFADNVKITFSIKKDRVEALQAKLTDVSNGKYLLEYIGSEFAQV